MNISKITPVAIYIDTNLSVGIGRHERCEIVPCTSITMQKYKIAPDTQKKIKAMWNHTIKLTDEVTKDLRPYQIEDCTFIASHKFVGCFNEQRTGKTPTAIRAYLAKGLKNILIVCPASAVYQWKDEWKNWTGEDCIAVSGTPAHRVSLYEKWLSKDCPLIISYDTLKDLKSKEDKTQSIKSVNDLKIILSKRIDGIICDEAHRFRNVDTATHEAVMKFKNVPNKLVLTGTPAPNKPEEIFGILHFLYPNLFTSYWKFIDYYFGTAEQYIPTPRGIKTIKVPGKGTPAKRKELVEFLSHISTQRKRSEVLPWLPAKEYQQVKLPLTKEQTKYIEELTEFFETEDLITNNNLDRLIKTRQICNAPSLVGLKGKSPKLDWLKQYLKDYPNQPVIIFSKFTKFLKLVSEELKIEHLIIGDTPKETRNIYKHMFQNGDINTLLINIDAGKEALTLDRAEVAIFLDKYPPSGDILQAEDRFVATTEDKKDKKHLIIEVMMQDSYDEKIYQLVRKGYEATQIINDYKKYLEERKEQHVK